MDTSFTRASAKGSRTDAQAEIAPDQLCGVLPIGFDPAKYSTKPWKVLIPVHDGFKVDLGHRTVQIIHTPGHTPDSICLIDRDNGLLFTGDTFYPGEIWLYRPETNFPAYVESVKTLASLAPEIKMILGAHNVPIAPPSVLPQLDTAIRDVLAGKVHPKYVDANQAVYQVGQISFRVHSPLPAMKPLPESN
jgi:glyoxylase-like metal-dependent hydrolase (beta-lactamase superfamily II)